MSFPAFAAPPILITDFLEQGEHMVGGEFSRLNSNMKGYLDRNVDGDMDISVTRDELTVEYGFGFTKDQMLTIKLPYVVNSLGKNIIDWANDTTTKYKWSHEGLGDVSAEYKILLTNSEAQRLVARLGATIPVGDDDLGESEIIEDGIKTQSLKKGGAGEGRTNYEIGLGYSFISGNSTVFSTVNYEITGTKTEEGKKEEPGDAIALQVGVVQKIATQSRVGAMLGYIYTNKGKDGDHNVSSYSLYGVSFAYFYSATEDLIIAPKLTYVEIPSRNYTNRVNGSTEKYSDSQAVTFGIEVKKTF